MEFYEKYPADQMELEYLPVRFSGFLCGRIVAVQPAEIPGFEPVTGMGWLYPVSDGKSYWLLPPGRKAKKSQEKRYRTGT